MLIRTNSAKETRSVAASLALKTPEGTVYCLAGGLGTGKTEFVRGFVDAVSGQAEVHSPSFSIVNTYHTSVFTIHHFDFYRLNSARELREIGFEEYFDGEAVCFIEWADMFPEVIPPDAKYIRFTQEKDDGRNISIDD